VAEPVLVPHSRILEAVDHLRIEDAFAARGIVSTVGDGVSRVAGLDDVGYEELVAFDSGGVGMAYELAAGEIGVILLSGPGGVVAGDGVRRLGRLPSISFGAALLGRVVDPLGVPLDGGPPVDAPERRDIFQAAPELVARRSVERPVHTGVTVIDTAIPIGRGQRELIVGDRNVGKTSLALDIIAAQSVGDLCCVYVAIGQPLSRILAVRETLARADCLDNVVIVAADASLTPGMQYLAPYAGATVAEALADMYQDSLIVYDDLSKHADAYRELALLLDRPSGREAYPGDIFHIHAELLERAAALRDGRSITAIPIVETTENDISAYIPTNLISIADGQIYLDTARFERDERPAIDVGRSVSRIGGAAQLRAIRTASRNLRILLSRLASLEALSRVGLELEESTRTALARGRILRELLRQPPLSPRSTGRQLVELTSAWEGWLDGLSPREAAAVVRSSLDRVRRDSPELLDGFDATTIPAAEWASDIEHIVRASRPAEAR
jgi:F-type H+-transporting ATPase subunit alpha